MAEGEESPAVPVVCERCQTRTRISLSELAETIERHNDRLHDGESVAEVDPAIRDELASLVADDLELV